MRDGGIYRETYNVKDFYKIKDEEDKPGSAQNRL